MLNGLHLLQLLRIKDQALPKTNPAGVVILNFANILCIKQCGDIITDLVKYPDNLITVKVNVFVDRNADEVMSFPPILALFDAVKISPTNPAIIENPCLIVFF
jgi:hypothetical protein